MVFILRHLSCGEVRTEPHTLLAGTLVLFVATEAAVHKLRF